MAVHLNDPGMKLLGKRITGTFMFVLIELILNSPSSCLFIMSTLLTVC